MKSFTTPELKSGLFLGLLGLAISIAPDRARAGGEDLRQILPVTTSTIPSNGDVNPYGVAFVPEGFPGGVLQPGDTLVSNFNDNQNLQGTGTTIVSVTPAGAPSLFYQGPPGLGLTAALSVLKRGFVLVGNLPTADGTSATVQPGSLLVLNDKGVLVDTLTSGLAGPWGLTVRDDGDTAKVFVSSVLSGNVTRFDVSLAGGKFSVEREVTVGSGFSHRTDPAALVLGPAGLALDPQLDILYVAAEGDNTIRAIADAEHRTTSAGTGTLIYQDNVHLHGPLGLVLAPNGHLITANADSTNVDPNQPSELVEFTVGGTFIGQYSLNPNNGGAFGVALVRERDGFIRLGAVDDNENNLTVYNLRVP